MRIEREDGEHVGSVWATVTPAEAWDLLDGLLSYFLEDVEDYLAVRDLVVEATGGTAADLAWHVHFGAPDELTLTTESPAAAD